MAPKVLNLLKFDFYCLRILYLDPKFYLLVFWSLYVEGGERKSLEKEKKKIKYVGCSHSNNENSQS